MSQLAHLRARRTGSAPRLEQLVGPAGPRGATDGCLLDWDRISQHKLDAQDGRWMGVEEGGDLWDSVRRVDGVPRDRVQSTEDGDGIGYPESNTSSMADCFAGKRMEKEVLPLPPQAP